MLNLLIRFLLAGLLVAGLSIYGFASPAQSALLPLIPREAQLVAGIEDPHNPDTRGHLLLVTMKNTFDFDDCQSLTGVDPHRFVSETIWVAASSGRGELNEHMLLIAGRFDGAHILQSAKQNGAATDNYRGVEVLLVKPFAREVGQMGDSRWMAILEDRAVVFGTPWVVERALDRYVDHEPADAQMVERLKRLHPQSGSWDVLAMPQEVFQRHAGLGQAPAPWIELLGRDMVEDADEVTLGIRFGTVAHVDFVIRTGRNLEASWGADGAGRHMFEASSFVGQRPRFEGLSIEQGLVRGSIVLPGKQLDACFKSVSCAGAVAAVRADR